MSYQYGGGIKNEPTIIAANSRAVGARGRRIPPCGTNGGYWRHIRTKEVPCDDCRAAYRKHCNERRGTTPAGPITRPACGTPFAAAAHRRRGERPCIPCANAETKYKAEQTARERAAGHIVKPRIPVAHGTNRGYRAHLRHKTVPCAPCREAHRIAGRAYRAA